MMAPTLLSSSGPGDSILPEFPLRAHRKFPTLDARARDSEIPTQWSGYYATSTLAVGRCRLLPTQRRPLAARQVIVGQHVGPAVALKWRGQDGDDRSTTVVPGNLYVATPDHPLWLSWAEPIDMFVIAIEVAYFEAVRRRLGLQDATVLAGLHTTDASLGQIVSLFQNVMEGRAAGMQAYLHSIASTLIAYVSQPGGLAAVPGEHGRLSPGQLHRVITYVERHIGEILTLRMLAEAAGLSLYHFATAFRRTTGETPHRFVVDRKIAYARMLLADQGMKIPDVAASLGFASQSHFTQQFRRSTGITPGRYQRQIR